MSKIQEDSYKPSPGKLRSSQLVTTFGPGSLVQTEHDSVLIMGTNFWWHKKKFTVKNHMYLQKLTGKTHFRTPVRKGREQSIVCTSFPKWGSCKSCGWLQYHKDYPPKENGFSCAKCGEKYGELLPARLVVTCNQGHLDEFPWVKWAHSNQKNPVAVCKENPKLKWKGGAYSSNLSNYKVECECGAWNSLFSSQDRKEGIKLWDSENNDWYSLTCTGQLPWLQQEEKCRRVLKDGTQHPTETEVPFGITGRASSMYYSKVVRGIIIPELAHPIVKYLTSEEGEQKKASYREMISELQEGISDEKMDEKIAEMLSKKVPQFKINSYTKEEILYFIEKLQSRNSKHVVETELDLKKIEYEDLQKNEKDYDFDEKEINPEIIINTVPLNNEDKKIFENIRAIPILTALEVLRYFTRISPPGELTLEEQNTLKHKFCQIESKTGKTLHGQPTKKQDWLPCAVKKGEGIFITFSEEFINNCLSDNDIQKRLDDMIQNHNDYEDVSNWKSRITIDGQFILLHSISHLLIKELALASGYNEASISERIYSTNDMRGLLIYTTSAGDGSLGGLVKQSKHLLEIIKRALKHKKVCSRDPICIHEDPKRMKDKGLALNLRQNGSACFGCMLLPETSCENFNKMLDRKILVNESFGIGTKFR
ncbi:DUF1998 domain-containing protein [Candidatus Nitrosopelagicus sp.]|nr:DUF1998 domain-containing protein [Candidatus Nitrosopelagicus sp.]